MIRFQPSKLLKFNAPFLHTLCWPFAVNDPASSPDELNACAPVVLRNPPFPSPALPNKKSTHPNKKLFLFLFNFLPPPHLYVPPLFSFLPSTSYKPSPTLVGRIPERQECRGRTAQTEPKSDWRHIGIPSRDCGYSHQDTARCVVPRATCHTQRARNHASCAMYLRTYVSLRPGVLVCLWAR